MLRPNQTQQDAWHTVCAVFQHPFVRLWMQMTYSALLSAAWVLSILVISNRLGLLSAAEQRNFASQIAAWEPIAPLFIHVAFVFMARPSFSWPVLPAMEERDASA